MKNWERGGPAQRHTTSKNVGGGSATSVPAPTCRRCCATAAPGLMHSMIYFGFLVLLGVTTVLEVDHQMPEELKFLHGTTYKAYIFVGDLAGLVFIGGIVWAIVRRYVQRPYRIRIKSKPEHAVILGTFFAIGVTGLRRRDVPHRPGGHAELREVGFVGYPLASSSTAGRSRRSTPGTSGCGSSTSSPSSCSSRSCRSRCCATSSPRR